MENTQSQGEGNELAGQVSNVVNAIKQTNQPPAAQSGGQSPQEVAGLKPDALNKALAEITGGRVQSYDQLGGVLERATQQQQLQQELQQLRSRKQPPLMEELGKLYESGATQDQINQFLYYQTINSDNLPQADLIKVHLRHENPGLDQDDINYLFEEKFGEAPNRDDFDDDASFEKANRQYQSKLKIASVDAKAFLDKQKKSGSAHSEEAQQRQQQEQQRRAQLQAGWSQVADHLLANPQPIKFEFKDDKVGAYDFAYEPPKDLQLSAQVKQAIVGHAIQQGLEISEANLPQIMEVYNQVMFVLQKDQFLEHMFRDVHANLSKHFAKAYNRAGVPRPTGSGNQAPQQENRRKGPAPKGNMV